ncbi:MAG TPA: site-2 protease family protein [Stellaceae bacterium]|jgi:Zn-dependent protease|nr:site-2 protease family protein [Stellaceae bacterium]
MMPQSLNGMIFSATTWILPLIFAVTLHEAAHGYVALRFGDDTALRAGRISLNPLNHIDPLGTILLPLLLLMTGGFLFGYAKPVPVNFNRLHHLRRDMVLVALAGPAMNVVLAIVSALIFYGVDYTPQTVADWLARNLVNSLQINAVLCVFNLLPLPPLDGGRIAVGILPPVLARPLARLEPYGMMILMSLFVLSYAMVRMGVGFSLLGWLVGVPTQALIRLVLAVTGQG